MSVEVDVYTKEGKPGGEKVTLSPEVFEIKPNDHAIYQAVRAYLANQRQGTHKTKTYGEVSGSGKKLWKQKHTGRARIGSVRSPLWRGGGTIFGPVPRDYSMKLPKNVSQLARKSALSHRVKDSALRVIEDFSFEEPKTKQLALILKAFELSGKKTLLLVPKTDQTIFKSGRNIPGLNIIEAWKASTYDLMDNQVILIQKSAVEVLERTVQEKSGS